ncbi:hypothetical protein QJS04_geneDACA020733 [Acorus gramineus]|uniref:Uncharacterized protein n=1 Tax=Acorus gramineus TaxID=55184 RepID=A0AAV9A1W0_ACOGR|nr:hypothetical protein QJS04_geneDACA020733 [Acorus gramineus]
MPSQKIETGHQDLVHDVAMDYYGKRLTVALSDATIKIISPATPLSYMINKGFSAERERSLIEGSVNKDVDMEKQVTEVQGSTVQHNAEALMMVGVQETHRLMGVEQKCIAFGMVAGEQRFVIFVEQRHRQETL